MVPDEEDETLEVPETSSIEETPSSEEASKHIEDAEPREFAEQDASSGEYTTDTADSPDASMQEPDGRPKAILDISSEEEEEPKKVELDLEDAPFLSDVEEEEPSEAIAFDEEPSSPEQGTEEGQSKKKLFIIGGIASVILAIILALVLGGNDKPQEQAPPPQPAPVEEIQEEQATPAPEPEPAPVVEPEEIQVRFDPFFVEYTSKKDELRFLEITPVFCTTRSVLADNLRREKPTVRYALYYFLQSKDVDFLADQANVETLKQELLAVTNQYMALGTFETLLFEHYLVK